MSDLKPLSREAIPRALERAERYRLLNEPIQAESICQDVLRVEADNQQALVTLLLAITDQFDEGLADRVSDARQVLPRLRDEYERVYYAGIICERLARAQLKRGGPGSGFRAHEGLRDAMSLYEKAEAIRPLGNDDSVLRWNTCARILARNPRLAPGPEERVEPPLE